MISFQKYFILTTTSILFLLLFEHQQKEANHQLLQFSDKSHCPNRRNQCRNYTPVSLKLNEPHDRQRRLRALHPKGHPGGIEETRCLKYFACRDRELITETLPCIS